MVWASALIRDTISGHYWDPFPPTDRTSARTGGHVGCGCPTEPCRAEPCDGHRLPVRATAWAGPRHTRGGAGRADGQNTRTAPSGPPDRLWTDIAETLF